MKNIKRVRKTVVLFNILIQFCIQGMEIEATEKIDFYEFTKKNYMFSLDIPKSKIQKNGFVTDEFISMVSEKIKQDLARKCVIKNIFFQTLFYQNSHQCLVYLLLLELDDNDTNRKKNTFYESMPFELYNNQVYFFSDDGKNNENNQEGQADNDGGIKIVPLNKRVMVFVCVVGPAIAYFLYKINQKINQ